MFYLILFKISLSNQMYENDNFQGTICKFQDSLNGNPMIKKN